MSEFVQGCTEFSAMVTLDQIFGLNFPVIRCDSLKCPVFHIHLPRTGGIEFECKIPYIW